MTVREAFASDAGVLSALAQESSWTPRWTAAAWAEVLTPERHLTLVAEKDGHAVGFVSAGVVVDVAEIESMAVDARWQRKGVARALFEALRQRAAARGLSALQLEVNERNEVALAFYSAMGFREQGRRRGYYASGEDAVLMGLSLASDAG